MAIKKKFKKDAIYLSRDTDANEAAPRLLDEIVVSPGRFSVMRGSGDYVTDLANNMRRMRYAAARRRMHGIKGDYGESTVDDMGIPDYWIDTYRNADRELQDAMFNDYRFANFVKGIASGLVSAPFTPMGFKGAKTGWLAFSKTMPKGLINDVPKAVGRLLAKKWPLTAARWMGSSAGKITNLALNIAGNTGNLMLEGKWMQDAASGLLDDAKGWYQWQSGNGKAPIWDTAKDAGMIGLTMLGFPSGVRNLSEELGSFGSATKSIWPTLSGVGIATGIALPGVASSYLLYGGSHGGNHLEEGNNQE